jgi:hypothetical protein
MLIYAQAGMAAAIGLAFNRRHLPGVLLTVTLALCLCALAAVTRSGTHGAWILATGFEAAFAAVGLIRFFFARFLGGTLFGLIALGVLVHPVVARAFGLQGHRRGQELGGAPVGDPGDSAEGALGSRAAG